MEDIKDFKFTSLENSRFINPFRVCYVQDNVSKCWDLIKTRPSVLIILFNISKQALVFVKQFRPGAYVNSIPIEDRKEPIDMKKYPARLGITLEFCAGIVDKDKPLEEVASEEVYEECGYSVDPKKLEIITTVRSAIGNSGDTLTWFFAEIEDSMKSGPGGGLANEGELIEVVEMPVEDAFKLISQPNLHLPSETFGGILWFFSQKYKGGLMKKII